MSAGESASGSASATDPDPAPAEPPIEWRARAVQVLPTEHFTLQSARSATIADAGGRANLFLGSVSLTLVALALVGQASNLGTPFFVFALVLFPTLFFLGLATFARILQSTTEDLIYARGINRIRHFYLEFVPEAEPYFILSAHDDVAGILRNMAIRPSRWHVFVTTAGTIAVINSVIAGVAIGVVAGLVGWSLPAAFVVGAAVFALSVGVHYWVERIALEQSGKHVDVRFPSPAGATGGER